MAATLAPVFILPTSGPADYRGKYPNRARTVSAGSTGLHIELNDGTRLWTASGPGHFSDLPRVGVDCEAFRDSAVPMTESQHATLTEAAALVRTRVNIAGHGRRAALDSQVRAIVESIQPAPVVESIRVEPDGVNGILVRTISAIGVESSAHYSNHADAETEARRLAGIHRVSVHDFAANAAPELVANTTRACYWRTADGFKATGPDAVAPGPLSGAYPRLDSLMKLKGETAETISRVLSGEVLRLEAKGQAAAARRDSVEWHAGRRAFNSGAPATACPYSQRDDADSRFARWTLGWTEAEAAAPAPAVHTPAPARTVDATPSWAGIVPMLALALERGTPEGRRMAREELARMAALADSYVAKVPTLERIAGCMAETAHLVTGTPRDEIESELAKYRALLG